MRDNRRIEGLSELLGGTCDIPMILVDRMQLWWPHRLSSTFLHYRFQMDKRIVLWYLTSIEIGLLIERVVIVHPFIIIRDSNSCCNSVLLERKNRPTVCYSLLDSQEDNLILQHIDKHSWLCEHAPIINESKIIDWITKDLKWTQFRYPPAW